MTSQTTKLQKLSQRKQQISQALEEGKAKLRELEQKIRTEEQKAVRVMSPAQLRRLATMLAKDHPALSSPELVLAALAVSTKGAESAKASPGST